MKLTPLGKTEITGTFSKIEGLDEFIASIPKRKPDPKIEFIQEWFHPAGPVFYMIIHDCTFKGYDGLFDITDKRELRQV
jgi:hypothetical protein